MSHPGERNGKMTGLEAVHQARLPISDMQAEQAYIGVALYNPSILDDSPIAPGAFYSTYHGDIVRLMQRKREAGEAIDHLTISAELRPFGESMSESEWDSIITKCFEVGGYVHHASEYADRIRECFMRRSGVYASSDFIHDLYEARDVQAVISRHIDTLSRVSETSESDGGTDCATGLNAVLEGWKNPHAMGIGTGYPDLDQHIGGWQPQRLYLLAAKTAIGKSALAINFAAHVAKTTPVLFISLEMPEVEVFSRLASSLLRKSTDEMRGTVYIDQDTSELADGFNDVARLQFRVDDRGGRTISTISAQARKLHRKRQLGFLVVDYVGLVMPADPRMARYEQLGTISRGLKLIAKNLGIPVLALSQLSRQADGDGVRPQLHHLRESGNLEQDSDVVLLLHRARHQAETQLLIEKNRSGRCGSIDLIWNPKFVRYDPAVYSNAAKLDPFDDRG